MSDAIEVLKDDHEKVRKLLEKLTDTTNRATKKRKDLLQQIESEVLLHTALEEEIFYPAFREATAKKHEHMFFEAKEEHRAVEKLVLPDLKKTDPGSEKFAGRAKVLRELIEHHAEEEEEEMFPLAEKTMDKDVLEELGERMQQRKSRAQRAA